MQGLVSFLYPMGNCLNPSTGGQIYDGYLYRYLKKSSRVIVNYMSNEELSVSSSQGLYWALIRNIFSINKSSVVIFNSALFIYYIPYLVCSRLFFRKVKVFSIHHHYRYKEFNGIGKIVRFIFENICLMLCNGIISPNPYTIDQIRRFIKYPNIIYLRMSFDKTPRVISSYSSGRFLYVGSVYSRKGIHLLIEAIGKMSQIEKRKIYVDIVGSLSDTKYVAYIKRRIDELAISENVSLIGRVSNERLKQYYSMAYAFVLPSLLEGYGMVIAEAMSYGLPVIAFKNSAIPYIVKHEYNGVLAENENVDSLKDSILYIKDKVLEHRRMGLNAIKTFEGLPSLLDLDKDIEHFLDEL